MLSALLPTLLFVALVVWWFRRAAGAAGGGVLGGFGRSRALRIEPSAERVTFADIAGIDEAKAALAEIVDFLRNPDKYRNVGGRIPHGVLLTGPPGAGKTRSRSRAGPGAVLLDLGVGVRGDVRRRRPLARGGPFRAGQGRPPRRSSSSTSSGARAPGAIRGS